jgi:mannosidase alpha-like ER degradation enhancer 1
MFYHLYRAIIEKTRDNQGYFYLWVDMYEQTLRTTFIDSLGAFFPGLQVLAGDVDNAIRGHLAYYQILRKYGFVPERYDFIKDEPIDPKYLLRPEFIESTYFLYRVSTGV